MKYLHKIRPSKLVVFSSLGIVVLISLFISIILTQPGQMTRVSIDQKCQDFYNDLESQLTAIKGYSVEKGEKKCHPIQDEAGATDYSLLIRFRVSRSPDSPLEVDQSELNQFSRRLPKKNYQVLVENAQSGKPRVCVSASRYIDDDGKDYPQAGVSNGPKPRYIKPGSTRGYMSCEVMQH